MVGPSLGRLASSTDRAQSWGIVKVVAPVALLRGIALCPGIIVRYGRPVEKLCPRFGPPSLAVLRLFLACPVFHSRSSVTPVLTLLGASLVLPTHQAHRPVVSPRAVVLLYCTILVAQVGLGLDLMPV